LVGWKVKIIGIPMKGGVDEVLEKVLEVLENG